MNTLTQMSLFVSSLFFTFSSYAQLSMDRLKSFDCTLTHTMGVTKLKYEENNQYLVNGVRNSWIQIQYRLNSVGKNHTTGQSHISLSGGNLLRNQYLNLTSSSTLNSESKSANGSVFISTVGGSPFAPQVTSLMPVGQFYCTSIVIK